MSETGRNARDMPLGLMKTCAKLGLSFWDYLGEARRPETASRTAPRATGPSLGSSLIRPGICPGYAGVA